MIKLTKEPKPQILIDKETEWTEEYRLYKAGNSVPEAAKTRYRHPEIKTTLRRESNDKCIYCESKISHIFPGETDHIFPASKRSDLIVWWDNLAYICKECNREKLDYYDLAEPLINPYIDNPSDHLMFYGPMVMNKNGDMKGYRTVYKLKLSKRMALLERRKEKLESIQTMLDLYHTLSEGNTRDILKQQILDEAAPDKEFSAFVKAYLFQSCGW